MKNIIEEKSTDSLHGRTLYNTIFVSQDDVARKLVLDIGCGFGWFELNLLERGVEYIAGVELTPEALETAHKYINHPKVEFRTGNAIDLPFKNAAFNTVISWEVLEHIPPKTEDRMFREAWRVLKPGGAFYLSTPYNSLFSKVLDPAWWLIGHRHYSEKSLTEFASNNGFAVERMVRNGGWWEILGINNLYIAKWIFRRRPFFEKLIAEMQDTEYKAETGFANIFIKLRKF